MRRIEYRKVNSGIVAFERAEFQGDISSYEFWNVVKERFGFKIHDKYPFYISIIDEQKFMLFLLKYGHEKN